MEIAGLAVGVAGLATVFTGCIDAFDRVRVARTQDAALRILSTKLENQKVRFIIWGQTLGLDSAEGYDPKLDHPIRRDSLRRTMKLVYDLFMEGETLQARYGLQREQTQIDAAAVYDPNMDQGAWKDFFKRIRAKVKRQQKKQLQLQQQKQQQQQQPEPFKPQNTDSESHVMRWVIVDRNEFLTLVANLRELIDDLESMCKFADVHEYRRMRVRWEIESMGDTESLHLIRAASEGDDDDAMSIAASNRLDELEWSGGEVPTALLGPSAEERERLKHLMVKEEPALRFYTPPSSVAQLHRRSRSREDSRSPQRVDEGDEKLDKDSSTPSGHRGKSRLLSFFGDQTVQSRQSGREEPESTEYLEQLYGSNKFLYQHADAVLANDDLCLGTTSPEESQVQFVPFGELPSAGIVAPAGEMAPLRPIRAAAPPPAIIPSESSSMLVEDKGPGVVARPTERPGRYHRIAEQVREERRVRQVKHSRRTGRGRQDPIEEEGEEEDDAVYWVPQAKPDGVLYYYNTRSGKTMETGTTTEAVLQPDPVSGSTTFTMPKELTDLIDDKLERKWGDDGKTSSE